MEQVNARRFAIFVVSACLIGMVVGSAVTLAVLNVQRTIPSSGLVVAVNVGVYSDAACTQNLTSIDWGNVYPGGSVPRTIYVKNTGNAPITLSYPIFYETWDIYDVFLCHCVAPACGV